MKQICCVCGVLYGEKEPLDDPTETHGYCPECFKKELEKIARFK